ncbi:protein of unknown function DUF125 transmembrane [Reticulomyxa filosa]|uniref:Iron transporter n=1 Tax=Reticulomyxa filosa TaxID=46433 RepID=X6L9N7_RETFI|nr:protein of unknown function DUF125 transmembrane [Reticulomyxa filosa]|eukprot:ETN98757.1 protein of unknown function DUF125 transmembrane [Reticulomyxa filosa]
MAILTDLHHEYESQHIKSSEAMKDFVIGLADGLTVPFALVSGLSGVVDISNVILLAGMAEIAAGTIAMGLGGYLAAKTAREHYEAEFLRETREIVELPEIEAKEVADIFKEFGVLNEHMPAIIQAFKSNPDKWRDFMMKFELGLDKPNKNREIQSPLIIGAAYAIGGLVPLSPYFFISDISTALLYSIVITITSLLGFGAFKGAFTGVSKTKSALHTCFVGSIAALAAYSIASLFA